MACNSSRVHKRQKITGAVLGCVLKNRKRRVAKQGLEGSGDKVIWKAQPFNSM